MPRVKVLNYLKKVTLFFRFERDILVDGAQEIGRDAEKRGEILQGKVMHDAWTLVCLLRKMNYKTQICIEIFGNREKISYLCKNKQEATYATVTG